MTRLKEITEKETKLKQMDHSELLKLFEFVSIPAGKFIIGSPREEKGRDEDEDQVEVELDAFEMMTTQVTQLQYYAVTSESPSWHEGLQKPVHNVSWVDVKTFCERLNKLDPSHHYRLPTEAEWEYACRAGSKGPYGNPCKSEKDLDQFAHFDSHEGPINVKSLLPNSFGLYDMHGNVGEWCDSWFWKAFSYRVIRGGSWFSDAQALRSAYRNVGYPEYRYGYVGFRLVRTPINLDSLTLSSSEPKAREAKVEAFKIRLKKIIKELEELSSNV